MGADKYSINLSRYQDKSTSSVVAAGDDLHASFRHLIVGRTGWTVYLQRAEFAIITDAAHKLWLQDTAGTPVLYAGTKVSPGLGAPVTYDFGPDGVALTADTGLDLANDAAGLAGVVSVTAYMKLTPNTAISVAALAAS